MDKQPWKCLMETIDMSKKIFVYGASGHGKVISEIIEESNNLKIVFIDNDILKTSFIGYEVLHEAPLDRILAVIAIGNNEVRKKIVEENSNFNYELLRHISVNFSKRAQADIGTVMMAGVSINSEVKIGKHCIINTNSSVDHDCIIGDYVHISPNAALAGNVEVGEGSQIGIGATIIQGVKIGKWCTIGAGAVIIKDIPDYAVVVGNPGKIIKYNSIIEN